MAVPTTVQSGQSVALTLTVQGSATSATVDGVSVTLPVGKTTKPAGAPGDYASVGTVQGSGGPKYCYAEYHVTPGNAPPPPAVAAYSVVPSYCGPDANAATSGITKVCLGSVKQDPAQTYEGFTDAITVQYQDGSTEVLPIIARRPVAGAATQDELALYASQVVSGTEGPAMDMRMATLMKNADGSPSGVRGVTKSKKNFQVTLAISP